MSTTTCRIERREVDLVKEEAHVDLCTECHKLHCPMWKSRWMEKCNICTQIATQMANESFKDEQLQPDEVIRRNI